MGLGITLLFILFVFAAIILIVVILLQEGKGGGFGQALGEHGQATFGVGSSGINNFTAATAVVFLLSALAIHILTREAGAGSLLDATPTESLGIEAPAEPDAAPTGGTAPTGDIPPATPAGE